MGACKHRVMSAMRSDTVCGPPYSILFKLTNAKTWTLLWQVSPGRQGILFRMRQGGVSWGAGITWLKWLLSFLPLAFLARSFASRAAAAAALLPCFFCAAAFFAASSRFACECSQTTSQDSAFGANFKAAQANLSEHSFTMLCSIACSCHCGINGCAKSS